MSELYGFNAFSPKEVAEKVETVGVAKSRLSLLSLAMLGFMAGAFIGLGACFFVVIKSDASLSFAAGQALGGLAFCLGLILVIIAGAELFTGNNLIVMAWADRKVTTSELLRNWGVVCTANFVGAVGVAVLVFYSGHPDMNGHAVGDQYLKIAEAKCALPFLPALLRGVLCNMLVCLAVWMAFAGRSVMDKVIAIVFPISAFVAAGFEHSVANMYFIPMGMLVKASGASSVAADSVSWLGFVQNLVPVIIGNLLGGSVLVGLVYYVIYLRPGQAKE